MARTHSADNSQSLPKSISLEEIETGTIRLQEVLTAINDFSQDGFPYRDAAKSKAELQFRECVKHVFGERSQEFQAFRDYKLRTSSKAEVAQSIAAVTSLMQTLENKKLEIQGVKPPPIVAPRTQKIHPSATAQIRMVPPAAQAASIHPSHPASKPQMQPATAPVARPTTPPPKPRAATATQDFSATQGIRPAPAQPPKAPAPASMTPPAPAVSETQGIRPAPAQPPKAPPAPAVSETQGIRPAPAQPPQALAPTTPEQLSAAIDVPAIPPFQPLPEQQTLKLVRKICLRLHAVARQLRLRKDSRPTVEVEDDYDLQDLLRALLKMEFDEVGTDEWTPPYAGSITRTTLLLNREQIAIVAKKTRPGMTTKEIAEQVAADSAFYSARNKCTTLFCFVYDPEGRIGSPNRLETDLTSVSDRYNVEVLVAPK